MRQTPRRSSISSGLGGVWERAKAETKERFTALLQHVDVDRSRAVFSWLKRHAKPAGDGMTWRQYECSVDSDRIDLQAGVHRSVYPVQLWPRRFILKADVGESALLATDRFSKR
jgi:RNA-directed DNA polymerase